MCHLPQINEPYMSSNLSRRKFLQTSGALCSIGALNACLPKEDPFAKSSDKPEVPGSAEWYRGEEKVVQSACAQCPANCGISVRVVEGRAVKIDGNVNSKLVGGKLGPKGQTGLYTLYDPDRIKSPLKRMGNRGAGKWEPTTWDDAIKLLSSKIQKEVDKNTAHHVAILSGRSRGFTSELMDRFAKSIHTPNFINTGITADGAVIQAMYSMLGSFEIPGYDAHHTNFTLSLGSGLFESTCNGIHFARSTAAYRKINATRRSKIIQVEPYLSSSGKASDEWVPIHMGTYDVLALGIANVLIQQGMYDKVTIEAQTYGFDEFKASLEKYTLEYCEKITGISQEKIERLANELVDSKPSVVLVDARSTSTSNGFEIARAALALNILLGNINQKGGLTTKAEIPFKDWPRLTNEGNFKELQSIALGYPINKPSLELMPTFENLIQNINGKNAPYIPSVLLHYYSNPMYSKQNNAEVFKAYEKIDFIASFSPFMDETSVYADLILPDDTYLERWEVAPSPPYSFESSFILRKPVVKPLYDTQNTGDVMIQLAKSLREPIASQFPWKNYKECVEERLSGVVESGRGSITADSVKKFIKKISDKGLWSENHEDVMTSTPVYSTPSKKMEFYSLRIQEKINSLASTPVAQTELLKHFHRDSMDALCLPGAEAIHLYGNEKEFPLLLMPFKDITYAEGSGANIPYLVELAGLQKGLSALESWDSWIEISPDTANVYRLSKGDHVLVTSELGGLHARVYITKNVPDQIATMAMGKGHTQFGRFAKNIGSNPNQLLPLEPNEITGLAARYGTRIQIQKV